MVTSVETAMFLAIPDVPRATTNIVGSMLAEGAVYTEWPAQNEG